VKRKELPATIVLPPSTLTTYLLKMGVTLMVGTAEVITWLPRVAVIATGPIVVPENVDDGSRSDYNTF
jgi:hypothetical protein